MSFQAYHLEKVKGDQIYIKKPGQSIYVELDQDYYQIIESGQAGFWFYLISLSTRTAIKRAGSIPLFVHAWLVPLWTTTS